MSLGRPNVASLGTPMPAPHRTTTLRGGLRTVMPLAQRAKVLIVVAAVRVDVINLVRTCTTDAAADRPLAHALVTTKDPRTHPRTPVTGETSPTIR